MLFAAIIGIIGSVASILALCFYIRDDDDRKKARRDARIFILSIVVALAGFGIAFMIHKDSSNADNSDEGKGEEAIPPISVILQNSGEQQLNVYGRGDFMLWVPGGSGKHFIGKYTFNGTHPDTDLITINPDMQVETQAVVSNVEAFYSYFESGDYDLSLHIRTVEKGLEITDELMPFTAEGFDRWKFILDLGDAE